MAQPILESWQTNAQEWIQLIENSGIASRQITNPAILSFVGKYGGGLHLDLGCGEGWLSRALHERGCQVIGMDGTLALVQSARSQANIDYHHVTYQQIIGGDNEIIGAYDTIVLNYCLYQDQETQQLLSALQRHLSEAGKIIIQTVHPHFLVASGSYTSRWIDNAWSGLPGNFVGAHSWYCRTMTDWHRCISDSGYSIIALEETTSADSKVPISILFCLEKRRA